MKMDGFTIVRLIMLVIGTVLFLWFLIPALLTFNPNIGALTGMGLSALMIVYGIWGEKINHLIRTGWKSTGGRIVEILLLFVCAVILVLAAVTGAAMLKGGMGTPKPGATVIMSFMMRAHDIRIVIEVSSDQGFYRLVGRTFRSAKEPYAGFEQRSLSSSSYAAADKDVNVFAFKKIRQSSVAAAVCINDLFVYYAAVLDFIYLELFSMSEVLEYLSVLICYRYSFHVFSFL